jgi:hypothetical protein
MIRTNTRKPGKQRHSPYVATPREAKQGRARKTSGFKQLDLACPFYKRNPLQYPECQKFRFRPDRLADMTNHLRRRHQQPVFCPRCGEIFDGENIDKRRDAHILSQECQGSGDFDYPGVSRDLMDAVSKAPEIDADGATTVYEKRWYGRYRVLFGPEAPLPLSPHYNDSDPSGLRHADVVQNYIQAFVADDRLRRLANSLDSSHPELLHKHFVRLIRELQQWTEETGQMGARSSPAVEAPASESNDLADTSYVLELQTDQMTCQLGNVEHGAPYNSLLDARGHQAGSHADDSPLLQFDALFAQAAIPSPLQQPVTHDKDKQSPLMRTSQTEGGFSRFSVGESTQDQPDREFLTPDGIFGCSPFPYS